ncbi:MAG: DNA gyrase subunit A [Defluviitaleaceae bacterium]|nr:DNA gyrase subunit A [Defluviitaleaceae bacterium]
MSEHEQNQNFDRIEPIALESEMKKSYIEYAMSVIIARALPDVRDGLKPVHRRILYSMSELGLEANKPYKKSARITGDTMGKYHPHGNSSIYDAMVRMAQDFSMRYPLVDGHGNFGSMDGFDAAAERYTEARLSRLSMEMLTDIDKNTVDFTPNYMNDANEPTVLPSRFPNLLVNGSAGIAVGMATNIPPHNLNECCNALLHIIDNRMSDTETDITDLLDIVTGPDFPTGGTILGTSGIRQAYLTGRGRVVMRAKTEIEVMPNGRERIIVTEVPYQCNKSRLLERIGELVADKKIEGLSEIVDETNRKGVRIVFNVKKDANANVVLNQLYKHSGLQESFGVIMLALVDNKPRLLNLQQILEHYLDHQVDVVTRRTQFDLDKALKRQHILEGLLIAQDNIDEVIKIIRASKDTASAKANLAERFGLSDEQTEAIVQMRLRALTGLEKDKLLAEYAELKALIEELTALLNDGKLLLARIREELAVLQTKFADKRRTEIVLDEGEINIEDLIEEEMSVITFSYMDYVKRIPLSTYRAQNRGGKGVMGMQIREEDFVKDLVVASTHDYILYFTNMGRVFQTKAYEIPEAGRAARGRAIVNMLNLYEREKIAAVMSVKEFDENEYVMFVTRSGIVKKTPLASFARKQARGLIAISFKEDDELVSVIRTDGNQEIFIATRHGQGVRFNEADVRSMGRQAAGVRGIRLGAGDEVVAADTIGDECKLLFATEWGFGKCTPCAEFTAQKRGGKGVKIYKITTKTGQVVGVRKVVPGDELIIINSEGTVIRMHIDKISTTKRIAQGVKLINLEDGVKVVSMAKIDREEPEEGTEQE